MLRNKGSLSSTRIYMSALIGLVLICSFSCCSSTPTSLFGSSTGDIGENLDDIDIDKIFYGQNVHYPPFSSGFLPSSNDYINAVKSPTFSKSRLLHLLLNPALFQGEDRPHRQYEDHLNNRRYAPQSFHAMRG